MYLHEKLQELLDIYNLEFYLNRYQDKNCYLLFLQKFSLYLDKKYKYLYLLFEFNLILL